MTNGEAWIFSVVVWFGSFLVMPAVASVVWPVLSAITIGFWLLRWLFIGLDQIFGEHE
tara:strand:+ start:2224 stop:2397 length:174 start_codon:yes stop_codon:yes gene_type:complete